jgi:hypothetical protein
MNGTVTFRSLADAMRAGYQVYDRTEAGYLVRTRTSAGWAMALVLLTESHHRTTRPADALRTASRCFEYDI